MAQKTVRSPLHFCSIQQIGALVDEADTRRRLSCRQRIDGRHREDSGADPLPRRYPRSACGATKSPPGARRANVGPFSNEVTIIRPIRTCPVREFAALETIASLGDDRLAGLLALAAS